MKFFSSVGFPTFCLAFALCVLSSGIQAQSLDLSLDYLSPHWLVIRGDHFPGKEIRINYLARIIHEKITLEREPTRDIQRLTGI